MENYFKNTPTVGSHRTNPTIDDLLELETRRADAEAQRADENEHRANEASARKSFWGTIKDFWIEVVIPTVNAAARLISAIVGFRKMAAFGR